MNRRLIGFVFYTLTRALMTLLFCGGVYLVRVIVRMAEFPSSALRLYHSFPDLAEHITAGILFYLLFSILFTHAVSQDTV